MKSKALFLLYSFLIVFSFLASIDGMQINYLELDFFQSYYKIQNHIRSGKNINNVDLNKDMFISEYYLKDGLVEFKIEKMCAGVKAACILPRRKPARLKNPY